MKKGDLVQFRANGKWRPGVVDHVNPGDSIIVRADDEAMKYAVHADDVRAR